MREAAPLNQAVLADLADLADLKGETARASGSPVTASGARSRASRRPFRARSSRRGTASRDRGGEELVSADTLADGLARLSDDEFWRVERYAHDAAYAGETLDELLAEAGIEYAPLPDGVVAAVQAHFGPLLDAIETDQDRRVDLRFLCLDCGVHTGAIGQYPYSCPDELWHAVVPGGVGMLCLPCLARRLDAAGLPWPWSIPAEQMAADLLELQRAPA